ncbi:MAG: sensor histidine kinase [Gammaproteobacteria bacterium]
MSLGALFLLGVLALLYKPFEPSEALSLDTMSFLALAQENPPSILDAVGDERLLPDEWPWRPDEVAEGWYTTILHLETPPNRLWAIYLPVVWMNAAVYLNGELLGTGGRFEEPISRNWTRPLYISIPNGMLRPGDNHVAVRLKTAPTASGYLGKVYLGPDDLLHPSYQFQYLIRVTSLQIIVVSLLGIAFFMGLLGLLRRGASVYLWFAALAVCWSIYNFSLLIPEVWPSDRAWDQVRIGALAFSVCILIPFIRRFCGLEKSAWERRVFIGTGIAFALLAAVPDSWYYPHGTRAWDMAVIMLGVWPAYINVRTYWKTGRIDLYILLVCGLVSFVLGGLDVAMILGLRDRSYGYLLPYAVPPLLIGITGILLYHFVQASNEAEALNRELEQRVEEKRRELAENYQAMQRLERERVLAEERERIMRDMHDGIGGQLVSLLAVAESGRENGDQVAGMVREALSDLRLMIDSFEPVDDDLTAVLAMYRSRIAPVLDQQGIELQWQISDIPPIEGLGPQRVLQILRILQEATTNALRHAGAGRLSFATSIGRINGSARAVFVDVCDDGSGFDAAPSGGGYGLRNMKRRAAAIGATLEISPQEQGTRVRLGIPLA